MPYRITWWKRQQSRNPSKCWTHKGVVAHLEKYLPELTKTYQIRERRGYNIVVVDVHSEAEALVIRKTLKSMPGVTGFYVKIDVIFEEEFNASGPYFLY